MTELSNDVNETAMLKLKNKVEKMQEEMHVMSLAIKIPKFRFELNSIDMKNCTHEEMIA